jgi:CMP-N-acetylneuraminic acid synthetase
MSIVSIEELLNSISAEKKALFDKTYAEEIYIECRSKKTNEENICPKILDISRKVLILASGSSILKYSYKIKDFIQKNNPVIISINHIPSDFNLDYTFFSNIKRYNEFIEKIQKTKLIVTNNIELHDKHKGCYVCDFNKLINSISNKNDNATVLLMNLLVQLGLKSIFVAGFDGYNYLETNYSYKEYSRILKKEQMTEQNLKTTESIKELTKNLKINFLTPSLFKQNFILENYNQDIHNYIKEKKLKILAMIPARMGSQRIKYKNLRLLAGHPLIYYPIKAAKESQIFDKIIVNSEENELGDIAKKYGAEFYKRDPKFATSSTLADEVVYDFITNNNCDIVYWVNPTAPLQKSIEMREALEYFIKNDLDSLITVQKNQAHCLYKGEPLNFLEKGLFARTQDLIPVQTSVFTFMMWKSPSFKEYFEKDGYAFLCGKVGYYEVNKLSAIDIDNEEDFQIANYIINGMNSPDVNKIEYDELFYKINNKG